jgi:hypothetical protein
MLLAQKAMKKLVLIYDTFREPGYEAFDSLGRPLISAGEG